MVRSQTTSIREFILDCVASGPRSVARQVAQAYGISRQAANRHLDALVDAGVLEQAGYTRSKEYRLRRASLLNREVRITPVLNPERLWDDHMAPVLGYDRREVRDLCRGAFGDIVRNVIEHAQANWITVSFSMTARHVDVGVRDDGRGFFAGVGERMGVAEARECALLLSRHANARSTDFPAVRLTLLARNFETFAITSSGVALTYVAAEDAWSAREDESEADGTRVSFRLRRSEVISTRPAPRRSLEESLSR